MNKTFSIDEKKEIVVDEAQLKRFAEKVLSNMLYNVILIDQSIFEKTDLYEKYMLPFKDKVRILPSDVLTFGAAILSNSGFPGMDKNFVLLKEEIAIKSTEFDHYVSQNQNNISYLIMTYRTANSLHGQAGYIEHECGIDISYRNIPIAICDSMNHGEIVVVEK